MTRVRLLIAGIAETNQRVSEVFADCDVTFAQTMSGAQAALADRFDAVLIAVRFDESRMFDLLRYLKADPALSRLPVVCYRSGRRSLKASELGRQAVELSARILGANAFVDVISESDAVRANLRLREAVFGALKHGAAPPKLRIVAG